MPLTLATLSVGMPIHLQKPESRCFGPIGAAGLYPAIVSIAYQLVVPLNGRFCQF